MQKMKKKRKKILTRKREVLYKYPVLYIYTVYKYIIIIFIIL